MNDVDILHHSGMVIYANPMQTKQTVGLLDDWLLKYASLRKLK